MVIIGNLIPPCWHGPRILIPPRWHFKGHSGGPWLLFPILSCLAGTLSASLSLETLIPPRWQGSGTLIPPPLAFFQGCSEILQRLHPAYIRRRESRSNPILPSDPHFAAPSRSTLSPSNSIISDPIPIILDPVPIISDPVPIDLYHCISFHLPST